MLELSVPLNGNAAVTGPLPLLIGKKQDQRRSLLKDRAVRGAVSLMLSAGASGGLGYLFWVYAAHQQSAAAVGKISAEVASITFLSSIGSLNLTGIFGRFLPTAGWRARKLMASSYAGASLVGLLVALIFLVSPLANGLVIGGSAGSLTFVLCVVLNCIFVTQDGGLIGFGRFEWIPVENVSVALMRMVLLPVGAIFLSTQASVLGAWLLPMALAVLVVNIFNLGPLAGGKMGQRPDLPSVGELRNLIAVGTISNSVTATVSAFLPALVTHRLGAADGGYFYVPWMIITMAAVLVNNITISMVREVVANPRRAGLAIRRSLALAALVIAVVMIACSFLARLMLAPLGSSFVTYGAPLMLWLGLAMPATAVIIFFWDLCTIHRRPWPPVRVNLFTAVAILGGVLLLHQGSNISSVGKIYCAVEWLAALILAFPAFRGLRAIASGKESRRQRYGLPLGRRSY